MDNTLAKKIRADIEDKKVSVSEYERNIGLPRGSIQNILNGRSKNPNIKTLAVIANALKCTTEDLLTSDPFDSSRTLDKSQFADLEVIKICSISLLEKIDNMRTEVSFSDYLEILKELYFYQLENPNKKDVNDVFLTWLIKKQLNSI